MTEERSILLILSAGRQSDEALEHAIRLARREGCKLVTLFILDKSVATGTCKHLDDTGFLGDEAIESVAETIMKGCEANGREQLESIGLIASSAAVPYEPVFVKGVFLEECLRIIESRSFETIIATRLQHSHLYRFIFGSDIDVLAQKYKDRIVVFEHDKSTMEGD